MARERFTVDMEALMVGLLTRDFPGVLVTAEPDTDIADYVPFVVVSCGNGSFVGNGPPGGPMSWHVHIMVVHVTDGEASDLADAIFENVWKYAEDWSDYGTIAGVGAIVSVEDISAPARTATTATPAGGLTQYDATLGITAHKA